MDLHHLLLDILYVFFWLMTLFIRYGGTGSTNVDGYSAYVA